MNCDRCNMPFQDGDEVETTIPQTYIGGKGVMQVEEPDTHHMECPYDDEDEEE